MSGKGTNLTVFQLNFDSGPSQSILRQPNTQGSTALIPFRPDFIWLLGLALSLEVIPKLDNAMLQTFTARHPLTWTGLLARGISFGEKILIRIALFRTLDRLPPVFCLAGLLVVIPETDQTSGEQHLLTVLLYMAAGISVIAGAVASSGFHLFTNKRGTESVEDQEMGKQESGTAWRLQAAVM
jgi:hypothetical protein